MQFGGDAICELEVEVLKALQLHRHLLRGSPPAQQTGDRGHLLRAEEVRRCRFAEAGGRGPPDQPLPLQGGKRAIQVIQAHSQ